MAVDEAVLKETGLGLVPPTLRLYAWEPACLSLGYAQPTSDVDLESLAFNGWQLVRRPTGGRAILHTDELTYSVIGPQEEPRLAGGLLESYQMLSKALLRAIRSLSVPAQSSPHPGAHDPNGNKGPVCFEVPSNYEITVNGKKLVGSAQARRREGVLQHGSLPLYGDLTRITRALCFPDEQARLRGSERLLERATTLESVLGYRIKWEQVAQAFITAFSEALNLELVPSDLLPEELEMAEDLVVIKYANPEWTEKV
jgi:lipoate-protein ligase A